MLLLLQDHSQVPYELRADQVLQPAPGVQDTEYV